MAKTSLLMPQIEPTGTSLGGRPQFRLSHPFSLTVPMGESGTYHFRIPAGFVTDFASVPRLLWWIVHPMDPHILVGAMIHDDLYSAPEKVNRDGAGVRHASARHRYCVIEVDVRFVVSVYHADVWCTTVEASAGLLGGASWCTTTFQDGRNVGWVDTVTLNRIERKVDTLTRRLSVLYDCVHKMRIWLLPIRPLGFTFLGEIEMALKFGIVLPERPVVVTDWSEITGGELRVKIGDDVPILILTKKTDQETPDRIVQNDLFVGPQGTACRASFWYLDDAGNASIVPITLDFTLVDTVPPVDPMSLGATMLAEIPDEVEPPLIEPPVIVPPPIE